MEDGYFIGSQQEAKMVLDTIKRIGSEYGYIVNKKSTILYNYTNEL